jgi:uncharacterized membrane protein HdeD (DUF308 family)
MDGSAPGSARALVIRSGIALVAGAVVLALPEAVAGFAGLTLLYALAALAIVTGIVNLAKAFRVREMIGWMLPMSALVLALGLAIFFAPAALGSALTRGLGGAVLLSGSLTLVSAARRIRAARVAAR